MTDKEAGWPSPLIPFTLPEFDVILSDCNKCYPLRFTGTVNWRIPFLFLSTRTMMRLQPCSAGTPYPSSLCPPTTGWGWDLSATPPPAKDRPRGLSSSTNSEKVQCILHDRSILIGLYNTPNQAYSSVEQWIYVFKIKLVHVNVILISRTVCNQNFMYSSINLCI